MRVILRLDGKESMAIAVDEAVIEVFEDGTKNMVGYAEFHTLTSKVKTK